MCTFFCRKLTGGAAKNHWKQLNGSPLNPCEPKSLNLVAVDLLLPVLEKLFCLAVSQERSTHHAHHIRTPAVFVP